MKESLNGLMSRVDITEERIHIPDDRDYLN